MVAVAYATDTASLMPGLAGAQYALGYALEQAGKSREAPRTTGLPPGGPWRATLRDIYLLKPLDLENLVIAWLRSQPGEVSPE